MIGLPSQVIPAMISCLSSAISLRGHFLLDTWYRNVTKHNFQGTVNVGAVDMTAHQSVGAPYGIKGFPTIKFFGYNKNKPTDYNGQRTADALGDESFKQLRSVQI